MEFIGYFVIMVVILSLFKTSKQDTNNIKEYSGIIKNISFKKEYTYLYFEDGRNFIFYQYPSIPLKIKDNITIEVNSYYHYPIIINTTINTSINTSINTIVDDRICILNNKDN